MDIPLGKALTTTKMNENNLYKIIMELIFLFFFNIQVNVNFILALPINFQSFFLI